ncbi:MAG: flagellar hook-associated protein FlgK [Sedimentisphaerales bacterium]
MGSFDIGLSGLGAAQRAFDIIGNNIANAATEGYHRQRLNLSPSFSSQIGPIMLGGGVDVKGVTRLVDELLENEIYRQQSSLGQISQELYTLKTVETTFGELSSEGGLSAAMDDFFNALQELSAHPTEAIWQKQTVCAAESMADRFRMLDEFLTKLDNQILLQADSVIEEVNALVKSIAELNGRIERMEIGGGQANNLRDQRDNCISQLAELVPVETQSREYGVVDLSIARIPVLTGTSAVELDVGLDSDRALGITVAGEYNHCTDIQGGQLGALFSLKNTIVSGIHSDLDSLASVIISRINQYHVQGVGSEGSFSEITGWSMASENLVDFQPPVSDGNIYIRLTNISTGQVTRTAIPVNVSNDSLSSIAADISNITGLSASVFDSRLHIQADNGYKFDFLPAVLPIPTDSDFTGASSSPDVSVSGIYNGTENQTFTFTVSGTGSIGNGTLQIIVANGDGDTVKTFNVGSGYAAGDILDVGNGIKIALGTGDVVNGNTFEVDAFAKSDTTGVLAASGINTFFSGRNAFDIAVSSDISDDPERIAASIGADLTDNENLLKLAALRDLQIDELDSMTAGEFYRRMVTDIGLEISTKDIRQENIQAAIQNLSNQQSEISGVNINDEAAQMLVFEQMFQAMAKYLGTVQNSLSTMMELL